MPNDAREAIALKILTDACGLAPTAVTRFPSGYCHSVYRVQTESGGYVLRVTGQENQAYYFGSVQWLPALSKLGIPAPDLLRHGPYGDGFYALISLIPGQDLGDVYPTLSEDEKRGIVKELSEIQRKVARLPMSGLYGYPQSADCSFPTWRGYLKSLVDRAYTRIVKNNVFDPAVCARVTARMNALEDYFRAVPPAAFLDDITTKNVLIHNGKLSGIVDVDEVCYGDALLVIGCTHMALLKTQADPRYVSYWLEAINADEAQRNAAAFYTLLFCVDFMGEQGMRFDNGAVVPADRETVDLLNGIYHDLLEIGKEPSS